MSVFKRSLPPRRGLRRGRPIHLAIVSSPPKSTSQARLRIGCRHGIQAMATTQEIWHLRFLELDCGFSDSAAKLSPDTSGVPISQSHACYTFPSSVQVRPSPIASQPGTWDSLFPCLDMDISRLSLLAQRTPSTCVTIDPGIHESIGYDEGTNVIDAFE